MNPRKVLKSSLLAAVVLVLAWGRLSATPREPLALPPAGEVFAAPYDVVWDATLKGLGAVKPRIADKATGRIETEPFTFAYPVGSGIDGGTQVLSIALQITVRRAGDARTNVQVESLVHDALLSGFTPGPTNNPWSDLFARIRNALAIRP